MELAVALGDGREVGRVQLGGGHLAALEQAHRLLGGEAERVDHARPACAARCEHRAVTTPCHRHRRRDRAGRTLALAGVQPPGSGHGRRGSSHGGLSAPSRNGDAAKV